MTTSALHQQLTKLLTLDRSKPIDQLALWLMVYKVIAEVNFLSDNHLSPMRQSNFMSDFAYIQTLDPQLTQGILDLARRRDWENVVFSLKVVLEEALDTF